MILLNVIFLLLASVFIYRGFRVFLLARKTDCIKESAIAMALVLMHGLIFARSGLLIEIGEQRILAAGLLLNYYLHLGTITIQMLISEFVIKFLYDKITTRKEES